MGTRHAQHTAQGHNATRTVTTAALTFFREGGNGVFKISEASRLVVRSAALPTWPGKIKTTMDFFQVKGVPALSGTASPEKPGKKYGQSLIWRYSP